MGKQRQPLASSWLPDKGLLALAGGFSQALGEGGPEGETEGYARMSRNPLRGIHCVGSGDGLLLG